MLRILLLLLIGCVWAIPVLAVPETVSLRVTDVTPRSFCLVWMSNQEVAPAVEVFADAGMTEDLTSDLKVEVMPDLSAQVREATDAKFIYRVRISGLQADTGYFVRSLGQDVNDVTSVGYSALESVQTANRVTSYRTDDEGNLATMNADLLAFPVYVRPQDKEDAFAGIGDLLLLETSQAVYPVTAIAGEGIPAGEAVIDLNNLFGLTRASLDLQEETLVTLRVYRGNTLSTLYHLRKLPVATGEMKVAAAATGWNRADLNYDGIVDASDFALFKEQYRLTANNSAYNPDSDFVFVGTNDGADEVIDIRDFGWFAGQFGKQEL